MLGGCNRPRDQAPPDNGAAANLGSIATPPIDIAATELQVISREPFGDHLADSDGRSLYLFTADRQSTSNCKDLCIQTWPPLLLKGVLRGGAQVDRSMIGTIVRDGGVRQVTYAGRPLYYYVAGQGPETAAGQGLTGFGGEWFLVSPAGESVRIPRPRP
jgi:predicted lipoprotein with Yx(FWY)xxD motif